MELADFPDAGTFRGYEGMQAWIQVLRFRDGRVVHATGYRDRSKALESVGLS